MKKKAKPEGCVHPDCFHCRLPDCKYSKTETSDSEYFGSNESLSEVPDIMFGWKCPGGAKDLSGVRG